MTGGGEGGRGAFAEREEKATLQLQTPDNEHMHATHTRHTRDIHAQKGSCCKGKGLIRNARNEKQKRRERAERER